MKRFLSLLLLPPALLLTAVAFVACPTDTDPKKEIPGQSAKPATENATVEKTSDLQPSVSFTLTSSNTGQWRVYGQETGGEALTNVTATFVVSTKILTLTASGSDLEARHYWVTVTENGKNESERLRLIVAEYVAPGQSATPTVADGGDLATKDSVTAESVTFTLTTSHTGAWKVYTQQTGGAASTTVTATFDAPTLTLAANDGSLLPGDYWVTVTVENDLFESHRLKLTVIEFTAPGQSAMPVVVAGGHSATKSSSNATSVHFTLSTSHTGEWRVYGHVTGGEELATVTATFVVSTKILTLAANDGDLPAGEYWVSVKETGKTESNRLALTVEEYQMPQSSKPAVEPENETVYKTAATQKSVAFTLTSSHTGQWRVYTAETGGAASTTITAAFVVSTKILTLTNTAGDNLDARTYYVSVQEQDKDESYRLALTVGAQQKSATPTATVISVTKTETPQKAVPFTLTSDNDGTWRVYTQQIGGAASTTVTALFDAPTLTLTASGNDLSAENYYVSVQETGKSESDRLELTVVNQTVTAALAMSVHTVHKTAAQQAEVIFTFAPPPLPETGSTFRVYANNTISTVHGSVTAEFRDPDQLVLKATTDVPAVTYYVSVQAPGKAESARTALTVNAQEVSVAPVINPTTVQKTAAQQAEVLFTFTTLPDAGSTFKVYTATSGGSLHASVTAEFRDPNQLVLKATTNVPPAFYYVSMTEPQKSESAQRTTLAVEAQPTTAEPQVTASSVEKTSDTQVSVIFTLTTTHATADTWKVYGVQTGGSPLTTATASYSAPNILTLASTGADLAPNAYYVTVQEEGKAESARLMLTVTNPPAAGQSATPEFVSQTVAKSTSVQKAVTFTLISTYDGTETWKVYDMLTGGAALTTVNVSLTIPSTLTLTAEGDNLAAGNYYVTVQIGGESESQRQTIAVADVPPPTNKIAIGFGGLPSDPVTITGPDTVTLTAGLTVSVDNPGNYTPNAFIWILDGTRLAETGSSCTLTSASLTLGRNRLSVTAYKAGVPYSQELVFTVTN